MFALNREMKLVVHLREYVVDGDSIRVTLLDINVPWKTGVKESHDGTRGLQGELGKVNVVMVAVKIAEFYVFKCKRVVS